MIKPLILLAILELAYFVSSRLFLSHYTGDAVSKELIWTGIRIASLIIVGITFRELLFRKSRSPKKAGNKTLLTIGIVVFLSVPIMIGNWNLSSPLNWVYAATSIAIGIREEFVYRGVLQQVLQDRLGLLWALLISNIIFVFYHYGSLPFTTWNVFQFFVAGSILGIIYYQTQSIWLVAILHIFYDVIWSLTPILPQPFPLWLGYILLVGSTALLLIDFGKTRRESPASAG
ncbi:MAG: CPBP family intramembrane glutamic endopeptidase [Verrucomicrobiota bacterium]